MPPDATPRYTIKGDDVTLEQLKDVLKPTRQPVERPTDQQLFEAEQQLGLLLPTDYKEFIQSYGTGEIAEFIGVLNPVAKSIGFNLLRAAWFDDFDCYLSNREYSPDDYSLPRYPEPNGLLPWAHTSNGDVLYWHTVGDCDTWPVVVVKHDPPTFQKFQMGMVEFVARLVTASESPTADVFGSSNSFMGEHYVVRGR